MKICFVSNFLNHHQVGFCDELERYTGVGNFHFIAEEPVPPDKVKLGYLDYNNQRDYVLKAYKLKKEYIQNVILSSDVIIVSFSQGIRLIKQALKNKKIVFFYQERLFKDYNNIKSIVKFFRAVYYFYYGNNKNIYFLNASSYGKHDLNKFGKKYTGKSFKFGYFPVFEPYSFENYNMNNKIKFLFLGRLIDWKHPEIVFYVSKLFEEKGIDYHIDVVGLGDMYDKLEKYIKENNLLNKITLYGSIKSNETYKLYLNNDIFLFASDRREGWGAVLNEALYYGCVPIANVEAGATYSLIKNGENGYIYSSMYEFKKCCLKAYTDKESGVLNDIRYNSHYTIEKLWNYVEKKAGDNKE